MKDGIEGRNFRFVNFVYYCSMCIIVVYVLIDENGWRAMDAGMLK